MPSKISDLLAQITGEAPSSSSNTNPPLQKRKADDDLHRPHEKVVKREIVTANSSRPIAQVKKPSAINTSSPVPKSTSSFKPLPVKATSGSSNATTPTTPTAASISAKPPKKGSYAEIMARGKAAQATLGQVGKIQHKRIEKVVNKRDRQDQKDQKDQRSQLTRDTNGKAGSGVTPLKNGKSVPAGGIGKQSAKAQKMPEKKVKKAATATIGYTGTARPLPSAKSSSKPSTSRYDSRQDRDRLSPSTHSRHYHYASDEDEEDDEEDGYNSEASSDMEAGIDEVDEEEERAARLARLEDAEALREENRLKKEKEERRRRLAAMARR
jgi:protein SPT2